MRLSRPDRPRLRRPAPNQRGKEGRAPAAALAGKPGARSVGEDLVAVERHFDGLFDAVGVGVSQLPGSMDENAATRIVAIAAASGRPGGTAHPCRLGGPAPRRG